MPKAVQQLNNYKGYLYRVLKPVHPDMGITEEGLNETNMLIHSLAERIVLAAVKLVNGAHKKTVSSSDILSAVKLVMGDNILSKSAERLAKDSLAKFIGAGKGTRANKISRSDQAGLLFSVSRTENVIRHHSNMRVSANAGVLLASVLENISAQVLDTSGILCRNAKRVRLTSRCITLAINEDDDLRDIFLGSARLSGGVRAPTGKLTNKLFVGRL
jgi:histone H3/H4